MKLNFLNFRRKDSCIENDLSQSPSEEDDLKDLETIFSVYENQILLCCANRILVICNGVLKVQRCVLGS